MQRITEPYGTFGSVVIHPRAMQFVIDDLPLILLCTAGYLSAGMDGIACRGILLWASAVCSLMLLYRFVYLIRTEYRVSAEQLIWEHGVFSRSRDYIELYRVVDFGESRNFLQLLFGLKTVSVHSGDRTRPRLDIKGVMHEADLVSYIRERVEYNKQRKGIYEITNR